MKWLRCGNGEWINLDHIHALCIEQPLVGYCTGPSREWKVFAESKDIIRFEIETFSSETDAQKFLDDLMNQC